MQQWLVDIFLPYIFQIRLRMWACYNSIKRTVKVIAVFHSSGSWKFQIKRCTGWFLLRTPLPIQTQSPYSLCHHIMHSECSLPLHSMTLMSSEGRPLGLSAYLLTSQTPSSPNTVRLSVQDSAGKCQEDMNFQPSTRAVSVLLPSASHLVVSHRDFTYSSSYTSIPLFLCGAMNWKEASTHKYLTWIFEVCNSNLSDSNNRYSLLLIFVSDGQGTMSTMQRYRVGFQE